MKTCRECGETKPDAAFYTGKSKCKECYKAYMRGRYCSAANRNQKLRKSFGISQEEYDTMHKEQQGLCRLCYLPERSLSNQGKLKPLAVDHCHTTGKVRGLLCHRCNIGLGHFKDNTTTLENAIQYLKDNQ